MSDDTGLRARVQRSGEEALGRLAQDLLENPLVSGALARAFEAREKAAQAQEVAMGALNLPSAADLERLTRRVRSVSQRLEGIEDGVDRLDERLASLQGSAALDERLAAIEQRLESLDERLAAGAPAEGGDDLAGKLDAIEKRLPPPSVDRRLKAVQDAIAGLAGAHGDVERLEAIDTQLQAIARELQALRRDLPGAPEPVPEGQERLEVTRAG